MHRKQIFNKYIILFFFRKYVYKYNETYIYIYIQYTYHINEQKSINKIENK